MDRQLEGDEQGSADSRDYSNLVATWSDLTTVMDLDGHFLYCSAALQDAFGWRPDELVGERVDDFAHPDDATTVLSRRSDLSSSDLVTTSYRFRCREGSYRWVEATSRRVTTDGGDVVVSAVRDVTERRERESILQLRATTDPLTGVANRTVLMDRLRQGLRRLGRSSGSLLVVLYLDLDRFKVINDSLGHRNGDDVLLQMAERVASHLRPADTLARLGGDEFVLVAEGVTDEAAAIALANRIIEDGRRPFRVDGDDFSCTMSIGMACTADYQHNAEALLSEADLALYRAKGRGRDQVAVFDEELRTTAVSRLATERIVRRALDENRLVVEYQPIVDMETGYPVGAEALIRINNLGQLMLPGAFLEVAEETGLLIRIDEVVLADAVEQAASWRARLGANFAGVAVNVTARHLADSSFRNAIVDELEANGVPPSDLQIEVTEQVLLEASNSAMTGLRALRDFGVTVGLDDFGTRYSSLAYLRQFPLDFIKIDKSFVDDVVIDPKVRAIAGAIIGLSHAIDLIVVAEGVELAAQAQVLRDLGCDRAQGFLYGRSGTPEAIERPVLAWPSPPLQAQ